MGRKPTVGKEKIQEVSLKLFTENGYEGTSIRDIALEAHCSVGLIYNYFQTKDDVFDSAMELFFDNYTKSFEKIVSDSRRSPFVAFVNFFQHVEKEVLKFRDNFASKIHWTVRFAIRERTITYLEPFIFQILKNLEEWSLDMNLGLEMTSKLLAYGICGIIIHDDFTDKIQKIKEATYLIMKMTPTIASYVIPQYPVESDYEKYQEFIQTNSQIPAISKEKFNEKIALKEILLIKKQKDITGLISYSLRSSLIEYLLDNKKISDQGLKERLLITALARFSVNEKVRVNVTEPEMINFYLEHQFTLKGQAVKNNQTVQILEIVVPDDASKLKGGQK